MSKESIKALRFVDITLTTGTSKFGEFYYADNYDYNVRNVQLATVVTVGSNRFAVCDVLLNVVRVFCDQQNIPVTVRLLLK